MGNPFSQKDKGISEEIEDLKSLKEALSNKQHAQNLGDIILRLERKTQNDVNHCPRSIPCNAAPSNVKGQRWKVQIMNPTKTESSHAFAMALTETLKQRVNGIECISTDAYTVLDDKVPLIVVCPRVSRLQPDVDAAVESVQRSTPYVVIILHHGSERDLPALRSGQKLKGYKNVTFVDMGFNDQGEIFQCQHNSEAEVLLRSHFDAFNKQIKF